MNKRCPHCDTIKSVQHFGANKSRKDGLSDWCLRCKADHQSKRNSSDPQSKKQRDEDYRSKNKERLNQRDRHRYHSNKDEFRDRNLKYLYGISLGEYRDILSKQGGVCACCGSDSPGSRFSNMIVDHCHQTGAIRGLVCFQCNSILGFCKDNATHLLKLINYLHITSRRIKKQLSQEHSRPHLCVNQP